MTIALNQSASISSIEPQRQVAWSDAVWSDYVALRDDARQDWWKISFDEGWLWVDMRKEGANHAEFSDLLTAIFFVWSFLHPETPLQSYGRCLIEKPNTKACAPDSLLYQGENIPRWQTGETRWIDLEKRRLSDLVREIFDTTLSLNIELGFG
jgi:hypothetical protein